ncbi:MAG: hypothetical protein ACRCZI_00180, partial [Cetobacterium sp.]
GSSLVPSKRENVFVAVEMEMEMESQCRRKWWTISSQGMRIESRAVEKGDSVRRRGDGNGVSVPGEQTWLQWR